MPITFEIIDNELINIDYSICILYLKSLYVKNLYNFKNTKQNFLSYIVRLLNLIFYFNYYIHVQTTIKIT